MTHRAATTGTTPGPPTDVIGLDHTGIVVPDLERAIAFYVHAFGAVLVDREPVNDVDAAAIGLPGERVRLAGALLNVGDGQLELHEFLTPRGTGARRVCDTGIGHVAFAVTDIDAACERLGAAGVRFDGPPVTILAGPRAGRRWVYGRDPWGVVIELCQHPAPASPATFA